MKKKIHVLHMPDYRQDNPYQNLLDKSLKAQGVKSSFCHIPYAFFPLWLVKRQYPKIDVIHLHWVVDIVKRIAWSENTLMFYLKCLMLVVDCWAVRLSGVKIAWTIHNKLAHEQLPKNKEIFVRRCLAKVVSRIIVHSEEALESINQLLTVDLQHKADVIFHGNYIGVYPPPSAAKSTLLDLYLLPKDGITVSYIGRMRPYKGIESLIQTFKKLPQDKNITLLIAGEPVDKAYQDKLQELIAQDAHIVCDFSFLPDQVMIDYFAASDVICLPFSDTLTSGSTILTMSCAKPLILPTSAKVFGCVPDEGVRYFDNETELLNLLNNVEDMPIEEMGAANLKKANKQSWQAVAKLTVSSYQ